MKKGHILPVVLISIALIGCGNKNDVTNINATDQSISQSEGQEENQGTNQNEGQGENQDANQGEGQGKNQDVNWKLTQDSDNNVMTKNISSAEGSNDSTKESTGKEKDLDKEVAEEEIPGKITSFGDKSRMNNSVGDRELPIYCVDTEENKVAISFDAAWGAEDTQEILDILKKHDIHVTFFATGGWVESYPDDVKAVLDAGHDLGNHSENHKNMSKLSDSEKEEELMAVHRRVKELTGYDMFLFRPPYGDYDNDVINVAKDCGYYAIQWDVDSLDWKNYGVDSIIETVTEHKNLGNGSIILCHNGAEYTAEALDTLITKLEERGYEIVPVSELIYQDGFHLNFEGRQIQGN